MAPIPFIGRLYAYEYLALWLSFTLASIELFVRTVTLLLPTPLLKLLYGLSRNAFNSLSSPYSRRARNRKKSVSSPIAQANDFVELCELFGYAAEEHVVQTKDGYLLGLHRLGWRKGEEDVPVNNGTEGAKKKVAYLHHGLMMNSEVWVCLTERERCLPFVLVDQGYDVWLGNNRGNKYSKKSMDHAPTDIEFWDFSMDQFAFYDIPDSINYILATTGQSSLSYIGFSQGTAQAFATLSIHPVLNRKVDVFVALAPAMAPPGLATGIVSSLVKTNPRILFLLFGRRAILGSTTMWSALLYPAIFAWFIDKSLSFLFSWRMLNITPHQKLAAYPHLYSFTSTKSVVHWFQVIRNGTFQMYDDEVSTPLSLSQGSRYYKVAKFPTRNIRTPVVLLYGGSDSLVDIKVMTKELPKHTVAKCIPKYEHLDFLWARDVDTLVFPHVLEALETYANPPQTKTIEDSASRLAKPLGSPRPDTTTEIANVALTNYREDCKKMLNHDRGVTGRSVHQLVNGDDSRPSTGEDVEEQMDESDYGDDAPENLALTPKPRGPMQANDGSLVNPVRANGSAAPSRISKAETPRRGVVSPTARAQRDENRKSSGTTTSDDATIVPNTPKLGSTSLEDYTDNSVGPEGWWSNTSASSLSVVAEAGSLESSPRKFREP